MEVVKPSFVFINDAPYTNDTTSQLKRRAVRAQAARQQPTVHKHHSHQQVKSAAKWNKYQARKRNRYQTTLNTFPLNLANLDGEPQKTKRDRKTSTDSENAPNDYPTPVLSKSSSETPTGSIPSSKDHVSMLTPQILPGAGWAFPFEPLKCMNHPYTPMLLHHYLTNLATDIPELDAGNAGILRSKWFPMVITADATFNVVLLTAASHYAIFHGLIGNSHIKEMLLYLKCQTYAAVNQLISTSSPELHSDSLIGAVAKLASYEAMFGTPELYHLHIRNLQVMINARGGLDTLGLDGLLQRMVLWIDINSAFLLNSAAYFLPRVPLAGHVIIQQPNPSGFLGRFE